MAICVLTLVVGAYLAFTQLARPDLARSGFWAAAVGGSLATLLAVVEIVQGYTTTRISFFPGLTNQVQMTMAWGLGTAMASEVGVAICFAILAVARDDRLPVLLMLRRPRDPGPSAPGVASGVAGRGPSPSIGDARPGILRRAWRFAASAPGILLLILLGLGGSFAAYRGLSHRVDLKNLSRLQDGMTEAEVEALIGPGETISTKTATGPWFGRGARGAELVLKSKSYREVHDDGSMEGVTLQFLDGRFVSGVGPGMGMGRDVKAGVDRPPAPIGAGRAAHGFLPGIDAPAPAAGADPGRPREKSVDERLAEEAARRPVERAFEKLRRGPKDQADGLALLAMMTSEQFPRDEVIGRIEPMLRSPEASIRCAAVRTFQVWAAPEDREKLLPSVDDASPAVRQAAGDAFVEWRDLRAVRPIARRLTERLDRAWATRALTVLGRQSADEVRPYLRHADPDVVRAAAEILRIWGPLNPDDEIMAALAEARPDAPAEARARAINTLLHLKPGPDAARRAAVAAALAGMLRDPSLGKHALQALGRWGTAEQAGALIDLLASHDTGTRHLAIDALGHIGAGEAVGPLADRLGEFFDRSPAIRALIAIGPASEPAMIQRLRQGDDQVRLAACQILQSVGTRRSLAALQADAAGDPNAGVARAAVLAHRTISNRIQAARRPGAAGGAEPPPNRSRRPSRLPSKNP